MLLVKGVVLNSKNNDHVFRHFPIVRVMNQEDELDVKIEIGNKKRSCVVLLTKKQNLYTCDNMSSVIN